MPFSVGVGGAWKQATPSGQRVGVGGSWRTIEKMWVGVGGTWRQFFVREISTNFTLTAGTFFDGSNTHTGYSQSVMGSISSSDDGNGKTITTVEDVTNGTSVVVISGFSSDPGASYLKSITNSTDSKSWNGSDAIYSYSSGTATWAKSGLNLLFSSTGSKSMTIVIQP